MGEIADAMLEGIFCACCGEVFEDMLGDEEPPGYPRYCASCQPDFEQEIDDPPPLRFGCNRCDRVLKSYEAWVQHNRDKHGLTEEEAVEEARS